MYLKPFHETLIDMIKLGSGRSVEHVLFLFDIIKITKIPKGQAEIISAIEKYFDFPGASKYARDIREVKENLLAQQKLAVEEEKKKREVRTEDLLYELNKRRREPLSMSQTIKDKEKIQKP